MCPVGPAHLAHESGDTARRSALTFNALSEGVAMEEPDHRDVRGALGDVTARATHERPGALPVVRR
ncbi:hypothetical protein GCM10012280_60560 [Wenjunlia tyrosinilytica]|uniref:Uncharacterized protein n=1 Tax=Wenjunlia tyrosinilytica TaxID=1544741 RepID=A0A917ZWI5_9ACTN|nr:hypothetical protein GCM10012280_60560 [Wenjunlia tyrosinilytica]